ncbi:Apoptosis regulatory protein Siva-like [Homarus americanus]|uniref:Apoptosis regulatory protein Siva-like n=1 Tax=Homarus americanus TaxID=6706 RepID=A0A8J5N747_HOMAM|nr:Apoptosis regulatory protein Siva-like [Homarus americanus]
MTGCKHRLLGIGGTVSDFPSPNYKYNQAKMPKRPCPFEESLSPLMKVHIGEKEVECGVMRRDKMKAVYDRTLNLLYCGAKNVTNNNAVEKMDTSPTKQMNNSSCPNLHQMVLTSSGTLVRSLPTSQISSRRKKCMFKLLLDCM